MAENSDWIKLYRKTLKNPHMRGRRLALWVTLLLLADHKGHDEIFNGERITLSPGQLITGRKFLALMSDFSESGAEKELTRLEKEQQIEQQKSNKNRLISIKSWEKYQQKEQQSDNKVTTKEQQSDTYKNDKNDKNDIIASPMSPHDQVKPILDFSEPALTSKEKSSAKKKSFRPPTFDEIKTYCQERKNKVDPERFLDFYQSKGWMVGRNKMVNWQAAVRTWERSESKTTSSSSPPPFRDARLIVAEMQKMNS